MGHRVYTLSYHAGSRKIELLSGPGQSPAKRAVPFGEIAGVSLVRHKCMTCEDPEFPDMVELFLKNQETIAKIYCVIRELTEMLREMRKARVAMRRVKLYFKDCLCHLLRDL
jgi:hypothetical protein